MKIAHISDFHIYTPPSIEEIHGKRFTGLLNLHLLGRGRLFSIDALRRSLEEVVRERPDIVVVTGDFTALSLKGEFETAEKIMEEFLHGFRVVAIPGNHDYYTLESKKRDYFGRHLGRYAGTPPSSHPIYPVVTRVEDLYFVGLNPCRPSLFSSGKIGAGELLRLERALEERPEGLFCIVLCHFPIFGPAGRFYETPTRRLINARALYRVISKGGAGMFLHGHIHSPYALPPSSFDERREGFFNAGSCSIVEKGKRSSSLFIYHVDGGRIRGYLLKRLSGDRFITVGGEG